MGLWCVEFKARQVARPARTCMLTFFSYYGVATEPATFFPFSCPCWLTCCGVIRPQISDKDMSLLEERIKRAPPRAAPPPQAAERPKSCVEPSQMAEQEPQPPRYSPKQSPPVTVCPAAPTGRREAHSCVEPSQQAEQEPQPPRCRDPPTASLWPQLVSCES